MTRSSQVISKDSPDIVKTSQVIFKKNHGTKIKSLVLVPGLVLLLVLVSILMLKLDEGNDTSTPRGQKPGGKTPAGSGSIPVPVSHHKR